MKFKYVGYDVFGTIEKDKQFLEELINGITDTEVKEVIYEKEPFLWEPDEDCEIIVSSDASFLVYDFDEIRTSKAEYDLFILNLGSKRKKPVNVSINCFGKSFEFKAKKDRRVFVFTKTAKGVKVLHTNWRKNNLFLKVGDEVVFQQNDITFHLWLFGNNPKLRILKKYLYLLFPLIIRYKVSGEEREGLVVPYLVNFDEMAYSRGTIIDLETHEFLVPNVKVKTTNNGTRKIVVSKKGFYLELPEFRNLGFNVLGTVKMTIKHGFPVVNFYLQISEHNYIDFVIPDTIETYLRGKLFELNGKLGNHLVIVTPNYLWLSSDSGIKDRYQVISMSTWERNKIIVQNELYDNVIILIIDESKNKFTF